LLKIVSLVCTLGLPGIFFLMPLEHHQPPWLKGSWLTLAIILLCGCALFTVRGYALEDGRLAVQRLFWKTQIPLATLATAELRPEGFGRAWRVCGNGGLYSFSGWYYASGLGLFRALATQTKNAVLLRFASRKPILITPGDPVAFLAAVRAARAAVG
jgi:hypothetical protein